jgi:hypothetical protein
MIKVDTLIICHNQSRVDDIRNLLRPIFTNCVCIAFGQVLLGSRFDCILIEDHESINENDPWFLQMLTWLRPGGTIFK